MNLAKIKVYKNVSKWKCHFSNLISVIQFQIFPKISWKITVWIKIKCMSVCIVENIKIYSILNYLREWPKRPIDNYEIKLLK